MRTEALVAVLFSFSILASSPAQTIAPLRAGDAFELHVGGVAQEYAADFALLYTIDQDGTVKVPFIGSFRAEGLRPAQLERNIETRLIAERIFTHPAVQLQVATANRHVFVSGGVRMPQRLAWTPDITLSAAIGECGGFGDFANGSKIRLIREGRIAGTYRLRDIQKVPSTDPRLLPGDQVVVPE